VSAPAIVAIVVGVLVFAVAVPLRVAVAKQRRAVETARARLASARIRRRAEGVTVEVIQKVGASIGRVSRSTTCALADDGFYCLSDDGRWGARVRFAPGAPEIGDEALAAAPVLITGARAVAPGSLADWLRAALASLPPDGLLLQLEGDLTWFVAVPDAAEWFAAVLRLQGSNAQEISDGGKDT
jgi:hypothetical protein